MTAPGHRSADVLILAAHPLELEPLARALGGSGPTRLHQLEVAAAAVGVGLAAAGGGAARALIEHAPGAAVLIGSYGSYPGHGALLPARLLLPSRVRAVDWAERAGKAAFPAAMPVELALDDALSRGLADCGDGIERGELATTVGITTDDALARDLGARSGCLGENLEALGVALACDAANVPFAALLACTNEVGAQGRAQWLQHRTAAADATAALVLRWLARGAPGAPPR